MGLFPQRKTKFERAEEVLRSDPIEVCSQILCALHEADVRHVRITHPAFSLDVRFKTWGKPQILAPWNVPADLCERILVGLEKVMRGASDDEVGLVEVMENIEQKPYGQDLLRIFMALRVVRGLGRGSKNHDRRHLRVAS